ncbi:protein timeless isoform X1 [Bactrocera neohumeralis]|uniref:protein timeless isoform X1 n=1 Tax=Bactrocera neohumeralis TaxID=98809 RepID=UPI002165F630|nr:protein timeless isoform X1 [Bactrocera neohumeralis]XP_050321702.1 protein timeless isoform X1 [Bactrocera neohumeralis]
MDWLLATPQIHSAFSSLGSLEGDTYVVGPNALSILDEINYKLTYEDQTLRTFRRAIGFGQNVRSDLIPLLENTKDDAVLDSVIRILVNLTVPVECLFSVDVMYRTEVGRHTIFELNKLLYTSKEAFTDPKSTKSVVEYMKYLLESDPKLSLQKCDKINNCLLLLRNVLHIPETNVNFVMPLAHSQQGGSHPVSMQNAILWNLFIQSIDKLLLYLMTCPHRAFWGVTMVQLIALMYKDQHVSTLQKLLNLWFEASLSESSEDNESNTSPPKQGSGDSSPMLTSDPTSDSSDNGSNGCKNECAEERRQALREEATEATLQEVSRKGHEYQNSMMCDTHVKKEVDDVDSGSTDNNGESEQMCTSMLTTTRSTNTSPTSIKVEAMDEMADGESEAGCSGKTNGDSPQSCVMIGESSNQQQQQHNQQPTEPKQSTTTAEAKKADADAVKFKAPTGIIKPKPLSQMLADMHEEENDPPPQKMFQKVPHSGQLNLTKGKSCPQKRECPSSQSELSDCGYGTQVENQESISTSSNDDDGPQGKPQHQKPPCNSKQRSKQRIVMAMVDKKELRRKKLVKRSKSSLINMKGLVQHTPTDEDISNLLKEFTVDFLLKGYGCLVGELHSQLLTNIKIPIDTSHFFWLVTYFLKFAAQLELDMEHINAVLTFDVISYLTYEGVSLCEQLELNSRQEGSDLKPYLRRMHLVVTAIREFLQAIETYKKVTHLSEDDRLHLRRLQTQISSTEDLRCLFVLLLRRFNPNLHTKQYLQDLVVTNHLLLLILDFITQTEGDTSIKMTEHISQFATLEVMNYYGMLLEDFNNNGEFVNDCIFTMMHHVGGDLGQIGTLFQPIILKTFSRIWEADYELCDDWSDLIEYVIHKFINTPQKSPLSLPKTSLTELTKEHNLENTVCAWTQEEMDTLYWYYVQSKKNNDVVGKIVKLFSNNGNKQKSRISIIQQLLQQDIITLVEYDDLMKFEDAEYQRALLTTPTSTSTESGIELKNSSTFAKPSDDIQILRDLIVKENKEKHLVWLQKILLECCYIKLILKNCLQREDRQNLQYVMEPVAYHYILKNKSIPVVQWNSDQATTMLYQPFVLLLHKLGFQLPADAGSIFARIPDFWTAEMMFSLARKLGPLDKLLIKFDMSQFEEANAIELQRCHHATAARGSLSSMSSLEMDTGGSDEYTTLVTSAMENANVNGNGSGTGTGTSTTTGRVSSNRRSSSGSGSMLAPVPEVDAKLEKASAASDVFAVPKSKHCNPIIRFTPDPAPLPPVPNWLQLVMRSKINTNVPAPTDTAHNNINNNNNAVTATTTSESTTTTPTLVTTASAITPTTTTATMTTIQQQNVLVTATTPTLALAPATTILIPMDPCPSINNIIGLNNETNNNNNNKTNNKSGKTECSTKSSNNKNVNDLNKHKSDSNMPAASSSSSSSNNNNNKSSSNAGLSVGDGCYAGSESGGSSSNTIINGDTNASSSASNSHHSGKHESNNAVIAQRDMRKHAALPASATMSAVTATAMAAAAAAAVAATDNFIIYQKQQQQLQQQQQQQNHQQQLLLQQQQQPHFEAAIKTFDCGEQTPCIDLNFGGIAVGVGSAGGGIGGGGGGVGALSTLGGLNSNLENEYSAMVASVYEHEIAYSDCASVASDLTRMYVSDEEDKNEFPVTHFT